MDLELRITGYAHPDATALIARVQQEYVVRYGEADAGHVDPSNFEPPSGLFLTGYLDGVAVATGAWRRSPVLCLGGSSTVEIKRMYVVDEQRGRGLSRVVLAELERTAAEAGHDVMILETGPLQPEAIALYRSAGYDDVPGFGHYAAQGAISLGKRIRRG